MPGLWGAATGARRGRRTTILLVVACLVLSAFVVVSGVLDGRGRECPAHQPDAAAARAAAARCGEPVEARGLSGTTELVTANPDGTMTAVLHGTPQRVAREGGWAPVDTSLDRVAGRGGERLVPRAGAVDLELSTGGPGPVAVVREGVHGLDWGSTPDPLPEPRVRDNTAVYPDVTPGESVRVEAAPDGFTHVVTGPAGAARTVRVPIGVERLALSAAADGTIRALDDRHRAVFTVDPAILGVGGSGHFDRVPATLADGGITYSLPATTEPWTLSIRVRTGSAVSMVADSAGTASRWNPQETEVSRTAIGFLQLDTSHLAGRAVRSARLVIPVVGAAADAGEVELHATGPVDATTSHGHQPAWERELGEQQPTRELSFEVTQLATSAAAEHRRQVTFGLRTGAGAVRLGAPRLEVTYGPQNGVAPRVFSEDYPADGRAHGAPRHEGKFLLTATQATTEFRYRWNGQDAFTRVPAAEGRAELTAAPPAAGKQVLEVRAVDTAGHESESAVHAVEVAALAAPTVSDQLELGPGGAVAPHGYRFRWDGTDEWVYQDATDGKATLAPRGGEAVEVVAVGADPSVESAITRHLVAQAAPGAPLVSSAEYPSDGAEHGAPYVAGNFTFRATGTEPVVGFRYQYASGEIKQIAGTGKATARIIPTLPGDKTLTVRSFTADGQESPATTYRFKVAPALPQVPQAPAVRSADYPADGQPHGAPGQAGTFTLAPGGRTAVVAYRYRVNDGPIRTVAGSGEVTVQATPSTSGTHTLTAWAVDSAGVASEPARHTFVVGGLPVPAPESPVVTSTDFPADGQPHGSVGQAGSVTVRTAGAVAPDVVVYQLDTDANPTEQAAGAGTVTLSVTPVRSGRRTLTVWAKVAATGALSAPTRHAFVVGAPSGPREFFYDAAGQLAGVANSSGESAAYRYDDSGNLERTERYDRDASAVFALVPEQGPVGASVEISGTGFGAQPADNAVVFDGIPAQVTAASPNRLTVVVPAGISDGHVRVTANGRTAAAHRPFVKARAVVAPSITAVSAARGDKGDRLTITGTGFDRDRARDVVHFHQTTARVLEASDTSLVVEVPDAAASGRVTVRTPGGEATSPADFLVAPRGFAAADLVHGDRLVVGTPLDLDIPAGKAAVVLVDGKAGERLNLNLENNTIPVRSAMWMFTPHGADFARRALGDPLDLWSGSRLHQDLPVFTSTGTYTIVVAPDDGEAGKVRVTLSRDLIGDKLTRDGSGVPFTVKEAEKPVEMPFEATAGEWVSLGLTDVSQPANTFVVKIIAPDGSYATWRANLADYVPTMVYKVKKTGTHKVSVTFGPSQLGFGKVWLSNVVDAPRLNVDGDPVPYKVLRPGQSVRLPFTGTAGKPLILGHTDNTMRENGRQGYPVSIMVEPDDVQVELRTGSAETRNLTIRKTGEHSLFISGWEAVGTARAWLSSPLEGGTIALNALTPVEVKRPGQEVWLNFDGVKDKPLTMLLRDNAIAGQVTFRINKPSGSVLTFVTDGKIDVPALPETGRYRVLIDPAYASTGKANIAASEPLDLGVIPIDGAPVNADLVVPGQRIVGRFTGAVGQRLTLSTASTSAQYITPKITKPDGSNLEFYSAYRTGDGQDLIALPVAGEYKVQLSPINSDSQPVSGRVALGLFTEVDGGKVVVGGAAGTITIDQPGRNGKITFDGATGEVLQLQVTRQFPDNTGVYYSVVNPDGTIAVRRTFASSDRFRLAALKATGTHTLVFDPANGVTGSMTAALSKPATLAATEQTTRIDPPRRVRPTCVAPEPAPPIAKAVAGPEGSERTEPERPRPAEPEQVCGAGGWRPDSANLDGVDWTTRFNPQPVREKPLEFPVGFTGVVGLVQSTDGTALRGVRVSTGDDSTTTDDKGRFALVGLDEGHLSLRVDGRTAEAGGRVYGAFDIGVDVKAGEVLVLPHTVFLPEIDQSTVVRVDSPTTEETVLTTPAIPGLEVRLPAGTVVRDADGDVATELSLTPIPIDRPPFPLPPTRVPVYFTVQPGGGYLFPEGATIVYPNYTKEAPGTRTEFWNYDPDGKGWHVYGHGTVSADGKQIVPDADVRFYRLTGAMTAVPGLNPPKSAPIPNNTRRGDPVDPATGLLVDEAVDLTVDDVLPIQLKRTYQQGDLEVRPFGLATNFDYGVFPWSDVSGGQTFQRFDLVQPDGSRVGFHRTSPGTDYAGAEFAADPTTTIFDGAVVRWNDAGWDVKLRDGTVYVIGEEAPLQEIRDKYGNAVTITRAPAPPGTDGKVRANGPVTQVTTPSGRWIRLTYDEANPPRVKLAEDNLGRKVSYTYDTAGRLATVTDPDGGVTRYGWDTTKGFLTSITDGENVRYLLNEYDDKGRVKQQTAADNGITKFEYVDVGGKITETKIADPKGNVERLVFNDKGQLVGETKAYGTALAQTTSYEYDTDGVHRKSVTDALNRKTTFLYDDKGYVKEQTTLAGTAEARTEKFERNGPNRELTKYTDSYNKSTVYEVDARGALKSVTDPENRKTQYEVNAKGLVTRVTDPALKSTTVDYLGTDPVRTTDPLGRVSGTAFDGAGRPVRDVDPLGAVSETAYLPTGRVAWEADGLGRRVAYEYNRNGKRTRVIDPRGGATVYEYDAMDRVRAVTDPLGVKPAIGAQYDLNGNLEKTTSRSGIEVEHKYDALNRRTETRYGTESTVTYGYDAGNRLRTTTDTKAGAASVDYDAFDRVTAENTASGSVTYSYSPAERDRTVTVAGRAAVRHVYDSLGQLKEIRHGTSVVSSVSRDAVGRPERVGDPVGGVSQTYAYDDAGQVKSITYRSGTTVLGDLAYTYDGAGQPVRTTGAYSRTMLPEPFGTATYDQANRLRTIDGATVTYDADGNLTSDGRSSYTWNARGQLASVSGGGLDAAFSYLTDGRRSTRTVNGTTTGFLYDGLNPLQEKVGDRTTDLTSSGVDGHHLRSAGGATRRFLTDGLGSTVGLVDANGNGVSYTYEPFGRTYASGVDDNANRFTGREDDGTGLYFHRARYYSPVLQRFLSEDPIGFDGGFNLHAYVGNRPTTSIDPLGTKPTQPEDCVSNSFTPDTRVRMADGSAKPIGDVRPGERVLATDPRSGRTEGRKVSATVVGDGAKALVTVSVEAGDGKPDNTFTATAGHPFWLENARVWRDAADLRPGDLLRTPDGTTARVTGVVSRDAVQRVHNLTVEGLHTFYVLAGETSVLSHNCAAKRRDWGDDDAGGFEKHRAGKGGTPQNNQAQNREFNDALRAIEREIGRKLSKSEQRQLHNEITGQGYGYHDIVDIGVGLFG
ncbi:RHS repeat-associated core domain-containing protein [Saccharothrix variisporea]|uniref:RHS repeat-associated core domain-containing protein n=1 Tax=Saccharothrix variisporea TaxID=543527 RepID=UPI0011C40506|nr:RHS repeat-associated core domain-containing protein [Saccharothrix variisporea]